MRGLVEAIVCTKYGSPDVLQLKEIQNLPKDNEVLVKVYATNVFIFSKRSNLKSGRQIEISPTYFKLNIETKQHTKSMPKVAWSMATFKRKQADKR